MSLIAQYSRFVDGYTVSGSLVAFLEDLQLLLFIFLGEKFSRYLIATTLHVDDVSKREMANPSLSAHFATISLKLSLLTKLSIHASNFLFLSRHFVSFRRLIIKKVDPEFLTIVLIEII